MTSYAIFGASSAIADYTARALAAPGARFFLVGRDGAKLEKIAADLRVRGATQADIALYDFSDQNGLGELAAQAAASLGRVDQALIAFGTLPDQKAAEQNPALLAPEIAVNFAAPAILAQHIANHMQKNGGGLLAVITSVAGDRGRGSNYAYGSAKGGLGLFLQGLRHRLYGSGVEILDIRPGFVDTPMTRAFPKGPLWAQPRDVGAAIAKAMRARKGGKFYVPAFWSLIMLIVRNLPTFLFHRTRM
jgi:decaprenylphospho-beta-D-erythro-pentofuranosid-2-ulose 2-reductase